jgi:hypothetical protein
MHAPFGVISPAGSLDEHAPRAFLAVGISRCHPEWAWIRMRYQDQSEFFDQVGTHAVNFCKCNGSSGHVAGMIPRIRSWSTYQ